MSINDKCYAPWSPEQVRSLNEYQGSGTMHEYTCGEPGCGELLVAEPEGWVCYACGSGQPWALGFHADGTWGFVAGEDPGEESPC